MKTSSRVEKDRQKRRMKRRFLSVFVDFIGFACKKRLFLTDFVGFVGFACKKRRLLAAFFGFAEIVSIVARSVGFIGIVGFIGFAFKKVGFRRGLWKSVSI